MKIKITPTEGFTHATVISAFVEDTLRDASSIDTVDWYFGDGETQTIFSTTLSSLSATHTYILPGTYTISAVGYNSLDTDGRFYIETDTTVCAVDNFLESAVHFVEVPPPTLPGCYTQYPYKVLFCTPDVNTPPTIDLYSQFSRSYPTQDVLNKWAFVRPEWKFVNLEGKQITHIKPIYGEVRIDGSGNLTPTGTVVGLTGTAEFYFIDDIYSVDFFLKEAPSPVIWASMQTSALNYYKDTNVKSDLIYSYSTTDVKAYAPHITYWRAPDYLKITENGVADFVSSRWTGAPVPFLVSAQVDTTILNVTAYDSTTNFTKYFPFALSANGADLVACAEDVPVHITVSGSVSATFDSPDNLQPNNNGLYKFTQVDSTGYTAPGFTRGIVHVFDEGQMQLSASAYVDYSKLHLPDDLLVYSPYVWVPNPAAHTLCMVYYTGGLNQDYKSALQSQFSTNFIKNISTPVITNLTTTSPGITGYSGTYAVAASPGQEPDFEFYTWVADSDLDKIYKYDTRGHMVKSIDLKQVTGLDKVTPADMALDGDRNLWVTCYDTHDILKFDKNGNFLLSADVTANIPVIDPLVPGMFDITATSSKFDDVMILEPTCIDTDTENSVWVSYSNPISSFLLKYDKDGNFVTSRHLSVNSTPQEIIVNRDNSFWLVESAEVYGHTGVLKKYNSAGFTVSAFPAIPNIGYLTCDNNDNPWFTYEYNKVGRIKDGFFTHVDTITSANYPEFNIAPLSEAGYVELVALEGIASNHKNLIFVAHSIENILHVYNARNDAHIDAVQLPPKHPLAPYNDPRAYRHHDEQWTKSIQVIGDCTGNMWSRKYAIGNLKNKTITGTSKILNFNKLNQQEVRKHNQDFNMSEQLANLAFVPTLSENSFLFDTFLKAIYGNSSNIEDTGTVFYEKTANFLANTNDIDTCEIDKLYNIAEMLDVAVEDYRLSYPAQLRQLMNLLSIAHSKLWGVRCRCNTSFRNQENCTQTDICRICGKCKINNRGKKIDPTASSVAVGTPIVIYEKSQDSYFLHYPSTVNDAGVYGFSELTAAGLHTPILDKYDFFEYIATSNNNLVEGVIDWNNTYTTLTPQLSTYADWTRSSGIVDNILNYYLYRGLNLI